MNRKLIVLLVVLAVLVGLSYYFGPTLAAWFGKARAKTDSIPGGSRAQHSSSATAEQKDRKSTRLNSSHIQKSRMPSSA